ncbi:MAG TPA: magnesium chelatase, partial [Blastocatellia bacterium]
IQTHYPTSVKEGVEITKQESWTNRHRDYRDYPYHYQLTFLIPKAIREVVEQIAFIARDDKRIDKRSGVSQRLPITVMEGVVSNAERRALNNHETIVTPRVSDIYAAIPSITGKIELEYEGEQIGAERIARDLIRKACGEVFGSRFAGIDFRQALDHFNYGNTLTISDTTSDKEALREFQGVNGLIEAVRNGKVEKDAEGATVSACELALEGLYAMKKLARTEEHGEISYGRATPERQSRKQNFDDWTGGRLN